MDKSPSMLAKPADKLPLEFRIIKKNILLCDNTFLIVVIQRKILNGSFLMNVAGMTNNDKRSNLHRKKTLAKYAPQVPRASTHIEVLV